MLNFIIDCLGFQMRFSHLFTSVTFSTSIAAATTNHYSTWMADSIISRGQGIAPETPTASTYLQIGIVQNALLQLINSPVVPHDAKEKYRAYVQQGTESILDRLLNASQDILYPLDRFSLGRGLLAEYLDDQDKQNVTEGLDALNASIVLQPRNQYGLLLLLASLTILKKYTDVNRRIMVLYVPQLELSRRHVLLHLLCLSVHYSFRPTVYTRDHSRHNRPVGSALGSLLRQHHGPSFPRLRCVQNSRMGEPHHRSESRCLGAGNGMVFHGADQLA